ncbi:MAG: GMC family oxidoreductase N-terminal domain-containing protein, partial [Candidatus Sulfotelmatobacter sp.]
MACLTCPTVAPNSRSRTKARTNALAKNILTDQDGHARGVAYIDRKSKQEVEVYGRAVVVAASCVESARILLNSKSRQHPNGVANSSQQLGRNLCDHLYGESVHGYLPQLVGRPPFPDHVGDSSIAWMPRWQNLKDPHEETFIRGYSVYPDGGCEDFPGFATELDGFGSSYKREIKRRYPSPVSFGIQAPTLRSDTNYVDLDPEEKDPYGIPVARLHFEWDDNVLKMWDHSKQVCADVLRAAGGVVEAIGDEPEMPGFSL